MPKFFFDVYSEASNYEDDVGEELPDHHAAWHEATRSAGESIKDIDGRLRPGSTWRMQVRDEFQNILYSIAVHTAGDER
jgi:hypothetical protein